MKIRYYLFLIFVLIILACDVTSAEDYNEAKIKEILKDIELSFNLHDLDSIMENYNLNYRYIKDGYAENFDDVREKWDARLLEYDSIEIREIEINQSGDFWVTVTCELVLIADGSEIVASEPSEENGDISYFYKSAQTGWQICGKDFFFID